MVMFILEADEFIIYSYNDSSTLSRYSEIARPSYFGTRLGIFIVSVSIRHEISSSKFLVINEADFTFNNKNSLD